MIKYIEDSNIKNIIKDKYNILYSFELYSILDKSNDILGYILELDTINNKYTELKIILNFNITNKTKLNYFIKNFIIFVKNINKNSIYINTYNPIIASIALICGFKKNIQSIYKNSYKYNKEVDSYA